METLHKHFRELTREVFARHGFARGELLANWTDIVGTDIAAIARPQGLKVGRGAQAARSGATLHLLAAPGRALEVSYAAGRIVERVNAFLGYGAVAAVKTTAAARWPAPPPPPPAPPQHFAGEHRVATIADDGLRHSLQRLGVAVAARAQSSPQGK